MRYFLTAAGTILLDQIVKILVRSNLPEGDSINIIPGLVRITHVENPGVAFGIMSGAGVVLQIIPLLIIAAVTVFILKDKGQDVLQDTVLTVIAAGGAGNLIDRFLFGTVTDMIDISFFPPVFNVADIAVTCGCGILILIVLFRDRMLSGKEAE